MGELHPARRPERVAAGRPSKLVVVLVATVDRRLLPALRFLAAVVDADIRAVHVAMDPARARELAEDWLRLQLSWLPLHVHDPSGPALADAVLAAVRREAAGFDEVVVVIPELLAHGGVAALLHRRAGRRIAARLAAVPGFVPLLAPLVPA